MFGADWLKKISDFAFAIERLLLRNSLETRIVHNTYRKAELKNSEDNF
jgi:hypothetical protein